MARISRLDASRRAKKGWQTRRRGGTKLSRSPIRGGYTWHRPNQEKVRLTGFTPHQVNVIKPALIATDQRLQDHVRVHANIKLDKPRKKRAGGEAKLRNVRKSTLKVSPNAFGRSKWDPAGVTAHEIGHAIGPTNIRNHAPIRQYQRDFQWKSSGRPTKQSPIRKNRTLQRKNMHEDFAETYRSQLGFDISKRPRKYYKVHTNEKRLNHMHRYYMK